MPSPPPRTLRPIARPSVADHVFEALHERILTLELPPGARLSETEVAQAMDVSRQPVRDAFYRLSHLGFLTVRPQRATIVSLISETEVMRARLIRMALEIDCVRHAAETLRPADLDALEALLHAQAEAADTPDRARFHALDDEFHHQICARSGRGFVWDLITEKKGHMDRVRLLTLTFAAADVLADHRAILEALRTRRPGPAARAMRAHLSRLRAQFARLRSAHPDLFAPPDPPEALP